MANLVILNNNAHRKLKIITTKSAEYIEKTHFVPVIGDELSSLVLDFPVFLIKNDETGKFALNALTGFEPGENLYLQDDHWAASYLPWHIGRQPFVLAVTEEDKQSGVNNTGRIAIDMDSNRVNESQGEAIFNEDGSKTQYLENIINVIQMLAEGIASTEVFISELQKHDLIDPIQLNITFANGENKSFQGLYSVNADKLDKLDGEVAAELHGRGFLQACYMLTASMGQIEKLIRMKNATL